MSWEIRLPYRHPEQPLNRRGRASPPAVDMPAIKPESTICRITRASSVSSDPVSLADRIEGGDVQMLTGEAAVAGTRISSVQTGGDRPHAPGAGWIATRVLRAGTALRRRWVTRRGVLEALLLLRGVVSRVALRLIHGRLADASLVVSGPVERLAGNRALLLGAVVRQWGSAGRSDWDQREAEDQYAQNSDLPRHRFPFPGGQVARFSRTKIVHLSPFTTRECASCERVTPENLAICDLLARKMQSFRVQRSGGSLRTPAHPRRGARGRAGSGTGGHPSFSGCGGRSARARWAGRGVSTMDLRRRPRARYTRVCGRAGFLKRRSGPPAPRPLRPERNP